MSKPRAVVIGYGFAGKSFHSYLISLVPGMILHGIASRDAATRARIATERGCKAYESFEQVIEDPEVDLVVLATPNNTHAELSIRAMRAGKHVVTDKVMALDLEECDRMIATAQAESKLLSVFQNRRWDGDYLTLRQTMADGALGDVRWLEMAWDRFGAPTGWRGEAAMGGGRFYDLGAHLADQLAMLFPQAIQSVYCRMNYDFPDADVESEAMFMVGFEDGRTGVCDLSSLSAISKPRFYARGTKATFIKYGLDPQEDAMKAGNIDAAREDPRNYARINDNREEKIVPTLPGRWRNYYENIADVLTNGADLWVKPEEVRRGIAILDAAMRSSKSGQVVELDVPALKESRI
ncbi:MAG: Gfo/Idh/MocA family oxidoreductase [Abitibacteriaceae bacterium]|nr:Gfo/Idh/MocA family oxidoreductase [Abditibacteriaceae bacterium]MBV9864891.1 Gfo/Idh/MocA family oxidoreductase [Abditibacteriaceae bacterium]